MAETLDGYLSYCTFLSSLIGYVTIDEFGWRNQSTNVSISLDRFDSEDGIDGLLLLSLCQGGFLCLLLQLYKKYHLSTSFLGSTNGSTQNVGRFRTFRGLNRQKKRSTTLFDSSELTSGYTVQYSDYGNSRV